MSWQASNKRLLNTEAPYIGQISVLSNSSESWLTSLHILTQLHAERCHLALRGLELLF